MQTVSLSSRRLASFALRLAFLLAAAAALFGLPNTAGAIPVVTVTNTNASGPGSLVDAINTVDDGGTINFNLTGCPCTITPPAAINAALFVTKSVTINGPGAGLLTISGGNSQRVFETYGSTITVAISGLSIKYGSAMYGSGVLVDSGTLLLSKAVISDNSSSDNGAGLVNEGTAHLSDVTISGNTAGSLAGGLYNAMTLTLTNVTINGNTATASYGGGMHNNVGASAVLTNVTLSGNSSNTSPGGISNSGALTATNSTIAYNQNTGAGASGIGNFGSVAISSTIVANNSGGNCGGTHLPASNGYNLDSGNSCAFANTGDLPNTNPQLVALAKNGGYTGTHALSAGSLAIDHIPFGTNGCGTIIATDQRGGARPMNSNCDIGAFEYGEVPTLTSINPTAVDALGPTFTLTLTGTNFIQGASAQWGGPPGAPLTTHFVSSTSLTATVLSGYLNTAGGFAISVKNPAASDGTSNVRTLTVNKLNQTITFAALANRSLSESPFTVSATATSGLTVTFTASGACSVAGTSVTLTSAGICTVTAHQAGNYAYNAAPDVARSFRVGQVVYLPLVLK